MTLEDLRAFVMAYRCASMSEAARRLDRTQGAIAHHVRRLEQELASELFTRMRRGVAPTETGHMLYAVASAALDDLDGVVRDIEQVREKQRDLLRLAVSQSIATIYLRRQILALRERRPQVVLEIVDENTADARIAAIREGRADLGLMPLAGPVPNLEVELQTKVELALLVHPEHPFAKRETLGLRDLAEIRYIAQDLRSATSEHIKRALEREGVELVPREVVEEARMAVLMVELGRGETFVPVTRSRSIERTARVKLVRVPSLPPLEMAWVARRFALLSDAARDFMEICREHTASRRGDR